MEKIQEIFGWVAFGLTTITFCFPIPPYIKVLKGQIDYEETPSFLACSLYINYFCWSVYGDMIFSNQLKYCFCIGSIIIACLMLIYLYFEIRKFLVDTILNTLILITGSYALYRTLTIIVDDDRNVGKICLSTNLLAYFTSVQTIYKVIKDKSYILISIKSCLITICSTICWTIYGCIISDVYLIVSFIISSVICLAQIILYFYFKRKYPMFFEKGNSNTSIDIEVSNIKETGKKEEQVEIKVDNSKNENENDNEKSVNNNSDK